MNFDFGSSEIFELIAEGDVQFFIHKDVLISQSQPFREATKGVWTEATERKIQLKDWDGPTVARLVQYLYTGDYQYPSPSPITSRPKTSCETELEADSEPVKPASNSPSSRPLTPLSECLRHIIPSHRKQPVTDAARLERSNPAQYDFKEVLLTHAKVYALAHYKSIEALRIIALERLHMTLMHLNQIQANSHLSRNIAELVSYTYSNTDQLMQSEEPLRKLVSQFTALNIKAFQTEPEAVELIGAGGDFVKDLIGKICRRIPDVQDATWAQENTHKGYVTNLRVVYGTAAVDKPSDCLQELCRSIPSLGYPFTTFEWLVPEYTTNENDACTSFEVSKTHNPLTSQVTINREGIPATYIEIVKKQPVPEKVTHVALARFAYGSFDLNPIKGYNGMSTNINKPWGDHVQLYLIWRSAKIASA